MKIELHERIKLRYLAINLSAYADGVVLMEKSQNEVKQFLKKLNEVV